MVTDRPMDTPSHYNASQHLFPHDPLHGLYFLSALGLRVDLRPDSAYNVSLRFGGCRRRHRRLPLPSLARVDESRRLLPQSSRRRTIR